MASRLQVPDIVKQLVAETAKVYHWPEAQLHYVEKSLREYPWTPEKIKLLEKTIHETHWTPNEIAAIEEAHRKGKLNVGFFVQNQNPKLQKFDAVKFNQGVLHDSDTVVPVVIPGMVHKLKFDVGFHLDTDLCSIM